MSARMRGLALAVLLAASASARAEWSANLQVERFHWNEQVPAPEVNETGARMGIGWQWQEERDAPILVRYRGGVYAGSVRYEGQTLFGGTPAQSTTDYAGIVNEIHLMYRAPGAGGLIFIGGLGLDYWERTLPFSSQREDWRVIFARVGIELGTLNKRGASMALGVKYPLSTEENAHLQDAGFDQNPSLEPGREASLYAELGYRFSQRWKVSGYYDSYRFAQSPVVTVTGGSSVFNVWQPRSSLDVVGMRLHYFF